MGTEPDTKAHTVYRSHFYLLLFNFCFYSYISKVDVLKILVTANYKYIPSLDDILETSAVTRLRNQLLEAEHYQLAVEVSRLVLYCGFLLLLCQNRQTIKLKRKEALEVRDLPPKYWVNKQSISKINI